MTTERSVLVRIPPPAAPHVLDLVARTQAALARAEKLPPGDRTEAVRFESLHASIDQLAVTAIADGAPFEVLPEATCERVPGPSVFGPGLVGVAPAGASAAKWIEEGNVVVELCLPHFAGKTELQGKPGSGPTAPAVQWSSDARRAPDPVRERFDYLLAQAVEGVTAGGTALRPSGIANRVLTEGLRAYVQRKISERRIDVSVIYRDGSKGLPFPLRALDMSEDVPKGWRIFRFALMSIRHVEMDTQVDGAWLRNVKISKTRVAGLTDRVVFETSLRQLRQIVSEGPTIILMYQTGLETAIVGFYRALIHHLLEQPRSVAVVPMYFRKRSDFSKGTVWMTK